jgi:hypothetical protein
MPDCLDNIIGLTENDCSCWDDDQPADFTTINGSETGFYITDPEYGFEPLDAVYSAIDCGNGDNIFDILVKARTKAIKAFREMLSAQLRNLYRNKATGNVLIGRLVKSGTVRGVKDYVGIELRPLPHRYGELTIQRLHLGIDTDGDVDVIIKSNDAEFLTSSPDFTTVTTTITAVANQFVEHDFGSSPIVLPFYNERRAQDLKYWIYYELPTGAKPLNNNYKCCGRQNIWANSMYAGGVQSDDGDLWQGFGGYAYGLSLDGFIGCNATDSLCDLEELNGYDTKEVVGRAIQVKAAVTLISIILDSSQLNRFTLKPKEELWGRRNKLNALFGDYVKWIASNLPDEAVTCLECKENRRFRRQNILS